MTRARCIFQQPVYHPYPLAPGVAHLQEGGQLGERQAQLVDEAKVLQRRERDRLQRPPARQPRHLKDVKALPLVQLQPAALVRLKM